MSLKKKTLKSSELFVVFILFYYIRTFHWRKDIHGEAQGKKKKEKKKTTTTRKLMATNQKPVKTLWAA